MTKPARLLVLALGLLAVSVSPAPAAPAPANPDVIYLMRLARARLNDQRAYARAVLLSATGTTANGLPTAFAGGINVWHFIFDNRATPKATNPGATLDFTTGKFGKIAGLPSLGLGATDIRVLPTLTLARALALIHKAGETGDFTEVDLRHVLGPGVTDPLYVFSFTDGTVTVDTKTGKVTLPPPTP